ncbi:hypothetical protein [Candidatus Bealeia paramacronuclearis]
MSQLAKNHHIRAIIENWDAVKAPIAIFWTWGGWNATDDMAYCNYLPTESMHDLGSENLYKKWQKSGGAHYNGGDGWLYCLYGGSPHSFTFHL